MKTTAYGLTDPGNKRAGNDDYFLVDPELNLSIVCDGVGGHAAGNVASQLCAETIREVLRAHGSTLIQEYRKKPSAEKRPLVADLIRIAISEANSRIFREAQADSSKHGMSTTVEVLLLMPDYAFLGHVGDSRTYLIRSGRNHQLTEDHKVSTEMQKQGLWSAEQAKNNPYSHVLTRAVGIQDFVQIDLLQLELMTGDSFILCSDGLADYLEESSLSEFMKLHSLPKIPSELVAFAKKMGGHDNITAVVARFDGSDSQTSHKALDALRKSEILGKVPLFRYLTYPELTKVLSLVRLRSIPPGQLLIEEGATSNEMFVIVDGDVEIFKTGQAIARRGKGDFLGEMGLLDHAPRSASVKTSTQTTIMSITRKDLIMLLRQDSQIAVKFLWALNQEITQRLRLTSQDLAYLKASMEKVNRTEGAIPPVGPTEIALAPEN